MFSLTFHVFDILFHLCDPRDLYAKSSEVGMEAENWWASEESWKVCSEIKQTMSEQIEVVESTESRCCYQKGGSSEGGHFLRIGLQKCPVLFHA